MSRAAAAAAAAAATAVYLRAEDAKSGLIFALGPPVAEISWVYHFVVTYSNVIVPAVGVSHWRRI